jgi:membrane protease YdiL (CAAX protease family)
MALGWLLPVDPNGYLLLGVPLTAAFQLLVRRRPLRELWVRDGGPFRLDRAGKALAAVLVLAPAHALIRAITAGAWIQAAWFLAAVAGALPAAYALRRTPIGQVLRAAAPATAIGAVLMTVAGGLALAASGQSLRPLPMLTTGLLSVALYLPAGFVLEEVAFRGALDAHLHREGEHKGWLSALFVSALWGLWHLPLAPAGVPVAVSVAQVLVVHCLLGVPLSFAWRRTGSLAAPALAHALVDGLRNGLQAL